MGENCFRLHQLFIYKTLLVLTNINSTFMQTSYIYPLSVDHQIIIRRNDMKRLLTGFTVTLVAVVWMMGSCFFFNPIAAGAQDTGAAKCKCGEHWKHRHGHHHLWKRLNLTDAQKKEMFSIRLDERAKMKPLVQKLKDGRQQLRALPKERSV